MAFKKVLEGFVANFTRGRGVVRYFGRFCSFVLALIYMCASTNAQEHLIAAIVDCHNVPVVFLVV